MERRRTSIRFPSWRGALRTSTAPSDSSKRDAPKRLPSAIATLTHRSNPTVSRAPQRPPVPLRPTAPITDPPRRESHLREVLEQHRAERARIQQRAIASKQATDNALQLKLSDALLQLQRIELEFEEFRRGASKQLAAALAENDALKAKLADRASEHIDPRIGGDLSSGPNAHAHQAHAQARSQSEQNVNRRLSEKPFERELSVTRLQRPLAEAEAVQQGSLPFGLRDISNMNQGKVKGEGRARSYSTTVLKGVDPNVRAGKPAVSRPRRASLRKQSRLGHLDENASGAGDEENVMPPIPRPISRKWSACF